MILSDVIDLLAPHPHITRVLSLRQLVLFVQLACHLRTRLLWHVSAHVTDAPLYLPSDVSAFLARALDVDQHHHTGLIADCWALLRDVVWDGAVDESGPLVSSGGDLADIFAAFGVPLGVGMRDLFPPTRTCLNSTCYDAHSGCPSELTNLSSMQVVHYTHEYGPLPAWSYSATCRRCKTTYTPNYYIHDRASVRTYYSGVPRSIHVTTHSFVEATVCHQITLEFVFGSLSATNSARVYNLLHRDRVTCFPAGAWPVVPALSPEIVLDAFFYYALLREHHENSTVLYVSHRGDAASRLDDALRRRNLSMVGPGQEHWNHGCDLCCHVRATADGSFEILRAVVMDGVSVKRPCCAVHDCKGRLPSQQARFCERHAWRDSYCHVGGCRNRASKGYMTCSDAAHRALDEAHSVRRTALFQLSRRLERQGVLSADDAAALIDDPGDDDDDPLCAEKPATGNRPRRTYFTRRRTHNEQLCVCPCGVILGRATFYGSEGMNGCRIFLRRLFPTQHSLPQFIFFDNACSLRRHILKQRDCHFDYCALPVDVFHMKTKHKDSDQFCGKNCNPALFPNLVVNGKWRYNSSAAEMTNAWFGGFRGIMREMREDRYDFFLDEMIKQRNRWTVSELRRRGAFPYLIPRSALLPFGVPFAS